MTVIMCSLCSGQAMGLSKAAVVQAAAAGFDLERGLEKASRLVGSTQTFDLK